MKSLASLWLYTNPSAISDLSRWNLPATLSVLYLDDTGFTGNIGGWIIPAVARDYAIGPSALSGDISSWVLPSTLQRLLGPTCGVSGDISAWRVAVGFSTLRLQQTFVTYGTGGLLANVTRNSSEYRFDNCAWTTAMVDRALADAVASATTGSTLNLGGTGATKDGIPTGGALNADYLTLVSRGWTVTITTS
jgi:hypothetical protein